MKKYILFCAILLGLAISSGFYYRRSNAGSYPQASILQQSQNGIIINFLETVTDESGMTTFLTFRQRFGYPNGRWMETSTTPKKQYIVFSMPDLSLYSYDDKDGLRASGRSAPPTTFQNLEAREQSTIQDKNLVSKEPVYLLGVKTYHRRQRGDSMTLDSYYSPELNLELKLEFTYPNTGKKQTMEAISIAFKSPPIDLLNNMAAKVGK